MMKDVLEHSDDLNIYIYSYNNEFEKKIYENKRIDRY